MYNEKGDKKDSPKITRAEMIKSVRSTNIINPIKSYLPGIHNLVATKNTHYPLYPEKLGKL